MWSRLKEQAIASRKWLVDQSQANPLAWFIILLAVCGLALVIWQTARYNRLGFNDKLLWNWMDLLLVPVMVAFVVWILDRREHMSDRIAAKERVDHEQNITNQRAATERKINKDRLNQQTLELCLEYISRNLLNAHASPVSPSIKRAIIRARVLEAIDSLGYDHNRRDQVLRFLDDMRLLHETTSISEPLFKGAQNLTDLKLRKADLRKVDFSGANLTSADLRRTRLTEARLTEARLPMARLFGACLDKADLTRADLSNAFLACANLEGATLGHAELNEAKLKHANLTGANLNDAHLERASLEHAILSNADLGGAVLKGAILKSAFLDGAKIDHADLRETRLQSANLYVESMNFVNLRGAEIDESPKLSRKLKDVLEIQGTSSNKSQDIPPAVNNEPSSEDSLIGLLVSEIPESEAGRNQRYKNAILSMSDLDGVALSGYDLSDADFTGSWLRGADLIGSILHRAKFINSDLTGAKLENAEMDNCNLTGATVTRAQLDKAKNVPPIYLEMAGRIPTSTPSI